MKIASLVMFIGFSFIVPPAYASKPTIISQIGMGAAVGSATGLTIGLLHKYYPEYNHYSFWLTGPIHAALLDNIHKEIPNAGIAVDISSFISTFTWFIALNKFK